MEEIIPAIVTPFTGSEEIDFNALKNYLYFLKRSGIEIVFSLGTTGEFNMLTLQEKEEFIKKFRELSDLKVIFNVTENSLTNALKLARLAVEVSANGIASLPPIYHKPSSKGVITYFEELSKTGLPLFLYSYPDKVSIDFDTVKKLVSGGIIDGIKLTTDSLPLFRKYLELKEINKSIKIYIGNDELVLFSLMIGGDGAISAVANVAPEFMIKLVKLFKEGKITEALEVQKMVNKLNSVITVGDYPSGVKVGLKYRGVYVGSVRKPLEEKMEENSLIYATLKELGL